jgi:DNA (cytosine-5)-methyltransferase 1
MDKPRLLDLFCGAGGAAMGYHRAGFEVIGVDIKPQPHYPFEFHQADALTYPLEGFDAYHASPPCQGYSATANLPWLIGKEYPLLILPTRRMLEATNKPYVIENVKRARINCKQLTTRKIKEHGMDAGLLCGCMFDLPFYFERLFETNFLWWQPRHKEHKTLTQGRMFGGRLRLAHKAKADLLPWMEKKEIDEAIPPAYTEYIGKYLMQEIAAKRCCQEVMELKI